MENLFLKDFILPASLIVGSIIAGFIIEKTVLVKLKAFAAKTRWKGDDLIVNAFSRYIVLWCFLGGTMAAVRNLPIKGVNIDIMDKVLIVAFILSATIVLSKILTGSVELYVKESHALFPSTSIFTNLTKVLVFLIGGLIILDALHISITPLLTALGVGGLAVALALQETLSNLFAGIQVIASRQIKPGDYIKLNTGEEGYVEDITWRNTTIRALANNMTIVPNSKLSSALIVNFNMPKKELAVLVEVGVGYSSDLEKVERVTIEVAKDVMRTVQGGIPEFEPFIRYHTFGDSSINFTVILRGKEFTDQYLVKHEFIKRLFARYGKEGIEIPFPIRTVYMKDGK